MGTRLSLRLAVLFCLALLVIGCGGSSNSTGSAAQQGVFGLAGQPALGGPTSGPGEVGVGPGTGVPVTFTPTGAPTTIVSFQVAPNPVLLNVSASLTLSVLGTTDSGETLALPGTTTATLSYLSADPTIASVSPTGVVTGVAAGSTDLTVTVDNLGAQLSQIVPVTITPAGTVVSPAIAYLFVTNPTPNGSGGSVSSIAVAPDGTLSVADDNRSVNRPLAIAVSPSQDFVYAVNIFNFQIDTPGVSIFSADRTNGALTFLPPVEPTVVASPQTMVIDPSGRFAYLTAFLGGIDGYLIETNGSLTPNPAVTELDTAGRALQIPTFNLLGNVLYLADRGDDSITVLDVNTNDGSLSFRHADFPTQTGDTPIATTLSTDGDFLYVANNESDSVSSYGNAAIGDLNFAFNVLTDNGPNALAVHPSLPVLYVAGSGRTVQSFTTDTTGGLTPLGTGLPTGVTPNSILVAPSGQYVYVVCRGNTPNTPANINAYTVDPVTGALSDLANYQFPELSFPSDAVIVSAQGR